MSLSEILKCSDCNEPFTIDSAHDCPGSVIDRIGFVERKVEELNGIIKSMVRVIATLCEIADGHYSGSLMFPPTVSDTEPPGDPKKES